MPPGTDHSPSKGALPRLIKTTRPLSTMIAPTPTIGRSGYSRCMFGHNSRQSKTAEQECPAVATGSNLQLERVSCPDLHRAGLPLNLKEVTPVRRRGGLV